MKPATHVWMWRKWPTDRWCEPGPRQGQRCRVIARGNGRGPRNILVEFLDGSRVVAPRFAVRNILVDP